MKCYVNEINKITKENMEIKEKIDILRREKSMLFESGDRRIRMLMTRLGAFGHASCEGLTEEEVLIMNRYDDILGEIGRLEAIHHQNERYIKHLREEYQKLHMQDFYRPMDEIDICNDINKYGCIIGVKF